jgi:hypothetical protein
MAVKSTDTKRLWALAGGMCSFSACRRPLASKSDTSSRPALIGEECHIVAKSPRGPRGKSPLPAEQRDEYENLILLCRNHHKEIDSNVNKYSAEVLLDIKNSHEDFVRTLHSTGHCVHRNGGVLLFFLDDEYHQISSSQGYGNEQLLSLSIANINLLLLTKRQDDDLIIPPAFAFESRICRDCLKRFRPFTDMQIITFSSNSLSIADFLEERRLRYQHAMIYPKYWDAYEKPLSIAEKEVLAAVSITPRQGFVTKTLPDILSDALLKKSEIIGYPKERVSDLASYINDISRSILYELIRDKITLFKMTPQDAGSLGLRSIYNASYMHTYADFGTQVPRVIGLPNFVVHERGYGSYDLLAWKKIFLLLGVYDEAVNATPRDIIGITSSIDYIIFISQIRHMMETGCSEVDFYRFISINKEMISALFR